MISSVVCSQRNLHGDGEYCHRPSRQGSTKIFLEGSTHAQKDDGKLNIQGLCGEPCFEASFELPMHSLNYTIGLWMV